MDALLLLLRRRKAGSFVISVPVSLVLLTMLTMLVARAATALRKMLAICEDFANGFCICFNATKSKCLVILLIVIAQLLKNFKVVFFTLPKNP